MASCLVCNRFAPPDPETGYDADGICPSCARDRWIETAEGVEREPCGYCGVVECHGDCPQHAEAIEDEPEKVEI